MNKIQQIQQPGANKGAHKNAGISTYEKNIVFSDPRLHKSVLHRNIISASASSKKETSSTITKLLKTQPLSDNPNLKTTGLAIAVHHGETAGNLKENAINGKSESEPLNEKGVEEINKVSNELAKMISLSQRHLVKIYVNDDIARNKETAEIIAVALGVKKEQVVFTDVLRSPKKIYSQDGNLVRSERFTLRPNKDGGDSIPYVRGEASDYTADIVEGAPNNIHIFVTNRVSFKGFENRADANLDAIHDYKLPTGEVRVVPINGKGMPINLENASIPLKEIDIPSQNELLHLADTITAIDKIPTFSLEGIDLITTYRIQFLSFLEGSIHAGKYQNVIVELFNRYPQLMKKALPILLEKHRDSPTLKKIIDLWINSISTTVVIDDMIVIVDALLKNGFPQWKTLLQSVFLKDRGYLSQSYLLKHKKVKEYFDELVLVQQNNQQFANPTLQTVIGEKKLQDVFVEIGVRNGGKINSYNDILNYIQEFKDDTLLVQGGGGSGKTTLLKKILNDLSGRVDVKLINIDLNEVENFDQKYVLSKKGPGITMFFIDGIDEKNQLKVQDLYKTIQQSNKNDKLLFVCASRIFMDDDLRALKNYKVFTLEGISKGESDDIINRYKDQLPKEFYSEFDKTMERTLDALSYEYHTPLVISMLCALVEQFVRYDENYQFFDKHSILQTDIYDAFIQYLYNTENRKNTYQHENRTKQKNQFMSRSWDAMRKEFLQYLATFNGGFGQQKGYFPFGEFRNNLLEGSSFSKANLWNVIYHRIDYQRYEQGNLSQLGVSQAQADLLKKEKLIQQEGKIIYDFIDSLGHYNLLRADKDKGYSFPHKSFQNYYANLSLQDEEDIPLLIYDTIKNFAKKIRVIDTINGYSLVEAKNSLKPYVENILSAVGFNDRNNLLRILPELEKGLADTKLGTMILHAATRQALDHLFPKSSFTYDLIILLDTYKIAKKGTFVEHFLSILDEWKAHLSNPSSIFGNINEDQIRKILAKIDAIKNKLMHPGKYASDNFIDDLKNLGNSSKKLDQLSPMNLIMELYSPEEERN